MDKAKQLAKRFMYKFQEDNVVLLGAAQAYYYLLSIVPLLIICFALIPYLNINPEDAISFLKDALPGEMVSVFEVHIYNLIETPRGGLLTVGIIGALWSASNAINALIKSMNEAYEVKETRSFIIVRLVALGLTIGMIISLLSAMLLPVFGNIIVDLFNSNNAFSSAFTSLFQYLRWPVSLIILIAFLTILYRYAPNITIPIKHVLPGAVTACLLWLITSFGFSFYVSNFGSYSAVYGSLGGIIILMIWFFLTGIILLVGAIINVIYYETRQQT